LIKFINAVPFFSKIMLNMQARNVRELKLDNRFYAKVSEKGSFPYYQGLEVRKEEESPGFASTFLGKHPGYKKPHHSNFTIACSLVYQGSGAYILLERAKAINALFFGGNDAFSEVLSAVAAKLDTNHTTKSIDDLIKQEAESLAKEKEKAEKAKRERIEKTEKREYTHLP
jgi:hypothetical protein